MLAFALPTAAISKALLPGVALFPLTSARGLQVPYGGALSTTVYKGRRAVTLTEVLDPLYGDVAVLPRSDFGNGTIEFDVAGELTPNAGAGSRSFVGIAFRGTDDMRRYENFYLRLTNGRSPVQELRNHAVQYCSVPNYTWDLLRQKRPFRYEAYADLALGAWTHVKVEVSGGQARFYVNRAEQPTLIVRGLLGGRTQGKIALWVSAHTRGYFSNLRIQRT